MPVVMQNLTDDLLADHFLPVTICYSQRREQGGSESDIEANKLCWVTRSSNLNE